MSAAMTILANLFIAVLGSPRAVEYIITVLESLKKRPDNAVDDEYIEVMTPSLKERVIDNKVPSDGNVILKQDRIEQVKQAHRSEPSPRKKQ